MAQIDIDKFVISLMRYFGNNKGIVTTLDRCLFSLGLKYVDTPTGGCLERVDQPTMLEKIMWGSCEQKLAEWSEEDQSNFNELSSFILETYRAEDASRLITWFKSLKERIQPDKGWIPIKESFYANNVVLAQKKDKSDVWEGYTVIADHTLDPLVFERYINIENIRPQSQWKPTEAMLEALYRVIPENVKQKSWDEMLLDNLYQGLKYGKVLSEK